MSQTCVTEERQELVPGTGTYAPEANEDWDALAFTNLDPVDIRGSWRFSFDPVVGSTFMTGVYDHFIYDEPRPNRYVFAVEFRMNEFRVRYDGDTSDWLPWQPGERLSMQSDVSGFKVLKDNEEVWVEE